MNREALHTSHREDEAEHGGAVPGADRSGRARRSSTGSRPSADPSTVVFCAYLQNTCCTVRPESSISPSVTLRRVVSETT